MTRLPSGLRGGVGSALPGAGRSSSAPVPEPAAEERETSEEAPSEARARSEVEGRLPKAVPPRVEGLSDPFSACVLPLSDRVSFCTFLRRNLSASSSGTK